ncbi:MAG: hypothetical protein LBK60_01490 [Verrucomicrobiales bacterium]|nr:hypothetical protein [Verrucomicrobiales bacterium]
MTRTSDILSHPVATPEEFARLKAWAASFNHTLTAGMRHDVFYDRAEKWLGFAEHCPTPVYWTGWHPANTRAETVACLQVLQAYCHMAYGMSYIISGDPQSPVTGLIPGMRMKKLGELYVGMGR